MEISLTKQQAFEIASFLLVPSKNLSSIQEVRKCASARKVFESVTQGYADYFKDLTKEHQEKAEEKQDSFRVYCETPIDGVVPTKEMQSLEIVKLDREMKALQKEIEKKATYFEKTEGKIMLTVTIDRNDKDFLVQYFEKEGNKFQLWQDGQRLEDIALLIDSLN